MDSFLNLTSTGCSFASTTCASRPGVGKPTVLQTYKGCLNLELIIDIYKEASAKKYVPDMTVTRPRPRPKFGTTSYLKTDCSA